MPSQSIETPTKSVSFADKVHMRLSLHISEYSEREIRSCFVDSSEIAEFKKDVKRTARMIELNECIDDVEVCRRGAEHMLEEATNIRYQIRRAAVFEVLTEQFWAEENACGTPSSAERIAEKYSRMVAHSAASARLIALADEMVVKSSSSVLVGSSSQKKKHLLESNESRKNENRSNRFASSTTRLFSRKKNATPSIRVQ
mmetsp:Transcript_16806/g.26128  ORF Transcript_16806/g.26128 Transcript_16806/m.26128 type:complete len:200 (+) Transcript_16806:59-658(+)